MTTTALDLLQPLRGALVPVPAAQTDICPICHSSTNPNYVTCYPCEFNVSEVDGTEILPITMSVESGLVHHHLRSYKDGRDLEERERLTTRLAALHAVFLANHSDCLGEWDYTVCVPSQSRSAVADVAERTRVLNGNVRPVLSTTPGNWSRHFTTERFTIDGEVADARILLLDDTYASGSSIHSAAAVLRAAGAQVIGPLVLGRHVNPAHPPSTKMLEWLASRRWDPERCCRCAGELRDPNALF